jgi:hypothetical protein
LHGENGRSDLSGESGPLDLDLTARVEGVRDLIFSVHFESELVSRGGASLELNEIDAPRVKSSGAWVWDQLRDMRNPPRVLAGLGVLGVAVATAESGLCGGARRRASFRPN